VCDIIYVLCLLPFPVILQDPAYAHRPCDRTDFPTKSRSNLGESVESFAIVDNNNTIVDIDTNKKSQTRSMKQYARRRTPFSILFPRYQDTRSARARNPQTRSHCGENGQTDCILNDLLGDLLENSLFALRHIDTRRSVLFGVKPVLCKLESVIAFSHAAELEREHILQNDFRILAALSHSLSKVVGQNASDPILFESLLIGAPTEGC
jgi:hypothetical protein